MLNKITHAYTYLGLAVAQIAIALQAPPGGALAQTVVSAAIVGALIRDMMR